MQTIELVQGSPAWHAHRAAYFNASDAPAMMGVSPYKMRSQLLYERFTGIAPEVDASAQSRFDDGHRFEALARPLAEEIIGEDLYPVVGVLENLSASFDGVTLDEFAIWEHKTLSDAIRPAKCAEELPEYLRIQMEHQLAVSGAESCLFMASKWSQDGELVEMVHHTYRSDKALRLRILAGWKQFAADLSAYQPVEVIQAAVAAPTLGLPAVSIQVQGAVSLISNLEPFGARLREFVADLNMSPSTDQSFADAEAAVKTLQKAQDALEAAEAGALAQTASIDDMRRAVALYIDIARTARLALEKAVKARKESIRIEIRQEAVNAFMAHVASLNQRIGKPYVSLQAPDFIGAMKGLKTVSSLRNAIDTLMASAKIEANALADKIEINLNSLRDLAGAHTFLFADEPTIVLKANDDLTALIKSRIADHAAAEAKRIEAQRARIAEEESIKAEAKVRAEQAAAQKLIDDEAARARQQADMVQRAAEKPSISSQHVTYPPLTAERAGLPQAQPIDAGAKIKLGEICSRLGFTITADFLAARGFPQVGREGASKLYRACDFQAICRAIVQHVQAVGAEGLKQAA